MRMDRSFNDRNGHRKIHSIRATQITPKRDMPNPDTDVIIGALEELIAELRKDPDTEYLLVRRVSKKELPPNELHLARGEKVTSILTNGTDRFLLGTLVGLAKMKFGVDIGDALCGED